MNVGNEGSNCVGSVCRSMNDISIKNSKMFLKVGCHMPFLHAFSEIFKELSLVDKTKICSSRNAENTFISIMFHTS